MYPCIKIILFLLSSIRIKYSFHKKILTPNAWWFYTFLGYPELDLTVFLKLSLCAPARGWQKFCGKISSGINWQNFLKLYIEYYPNLNWCLSFFMKIAQQVSLQSRFFQNFWGKADVGFQWMKLEKYIYLYKIHISRNYTDAIPARIA